MTPEQLRTKKNNIFATYKSIGELIRAIDHGDMNPVIAVGIAVNTTLEMLAKEAEGQSDDITL